VHKITPYTYTHLRETLSFSKIVGQQPHTNLKRTYWRCPNCHKDVRYLSGLKWTELNHIRSVGDINRTSTWSKSRNKRYVPESALPVEQLYLQSERALFGIHRSRGVTYPCGRPPFHRALRPLVLIETWLLGLVITRMHASPQTLWIVVTQRVGNVLGRQRSGTNFGVLRDYLGPHHPLSPVTKCKSGIRHSRKEERNGHDAWRTKDEGKMI